MGNMELEDLVRAIDHLAELGPDELADSENLLGLLRQASRLEAVIAEASAGFDRGGEWALDGARSAQRWLATKSHLPRGECARRIRAGKAVGELGFVRSAFSAGEISPAHVSLLVGCTREATKDALVRDEEMLVGLARKLSFSDFARAIAYWEQLADEDGADDDDQKRRNRRDVYLTRSVHGTWLGKMTLDPISGEIVNNELSRIERELFDEDWQKAKALLGREPKVADLERSASQRRADALVAMASRSAGSRGSATPLFTVLVGYETLSGRICELASGAVVPPGGLLEWLDKAYIERAVFTAPNRVEVSERSRLFTGATRRAIQIRDRGCCHPFCDEPVSRCQVDHVIPYSAGGPTTQDNGRLLCGFHNRARHRRPDPGQRVDLEHRAHLEHRADLEQRPPPRE
jgi:hypothetical protein